MPPALAARSACNDNRYTVNIRREWAMPHRNTFSIRHIDKFVEHYVSACNGLSIDPFANTNRLVKVTNDLDPSMGCDHCMDALEFLRTFQNASVDLVLFDPPYSPRQVSEVYRRLGRSVNMETTQSSFWSNMKAEVARILVTDGVALSFGWNSNGIGKTRGFVIEEILIVAHGGAHNDTICIAERKTTPAPPTQPTLFNL